MATTFPEQIQNFTTMMNVVDTDGFLIDEFQEAMKNGDNITASAILSQIPNFRNKLISADYFNTITDTCKALQTYYLQKFSPAYVVSAAQPATQYVGDFWFQVTG